MDQHDPSVSELLPLMRAASTSPEGPKWSREGSADSDGEWGLSQSVRKSQRPRNCTPIDSGSESDFRPVVKEEIKIEVTSPRVERPSSPSVSDDDPFSDRALHSLVKEEKYRPRSPSPSEDFIGFTEVDRDSACFINNAKRSLLLGCSSAIRDSTEVFAEGVFIKSQRLVINYRDVDGLVDSNIFCDVCCRDWDGECPVHGPLKIIHDTKARPGIGDVDRDVKTLPPSLSSGQSTNPASGTGVLAEKDIPARQRLGPYEGTLTTEESQARGRTTGYRWQIKKGDRVHHSVNAEDPSCSNWLRRVNCARSEEEQNLVAFQYRGQIYFRTSKPVPRGSELLVYYGDDSARELTVHSETSEKSVTSSPAGPSSSDPSVSELLPLMRAASTSPEGPKWSRKGSADSDGEWGPSQSVRKSQRLRDSTPIDSGSESDFRPVVKEEIKIEVTSPRVERPSSPSVSDDDPFSDRALHSLVKEEKYRPRSPSPSEDFIGFTEVDRDSACFISSVKRDMLLGCPSDSEDSAEVFAEGEFIKSQRLVINYRDVDGLDDSNIFCDVCCRDCDGECPVHGPLKIIHDTKARPGIGDADRDVKTLPPSLSSGQSTNPASGTGVLAEKDLPARQRLGPYEGILTTEQSQARTTGYRWQIKKGDRVHHSVNAEDPSCSNWLRRVNCARSEEEQNLVAFQYRGQIYFRTSKPVPRGSELLVYYGDDSARELTVHSETSGESVTSSPAGPSSSDPSVSELLPLMRAASTSPKGPKWSRKGSADSDGEWGPSQSVRKSQRLRDSTPIDSGSESDFRPVVKEEIKIEVTSPRVERPSSPSVSDDDPFSDLALHSLVKEEKYRPRSPSPSEDFIGFTEVDRDSACFISSVKRNMLLGCPSDSEDSAEVFAEGEFMKSPRLVINYRDVDGLDDSNIFCDVCCRDWDGECPVHGPLKIIHDTKARPGIGDADRDVKTLPPSLSSGQSTNPASGTGVLAEKDIPARQRLGPYEGTLTTEQGQARTRTTGYRWQIKKGKRVHHSVNAEDPSCSNWLRRVNCARSEEEQNLVAFQYRGQVYFRTSKPLPRGSELLVYYGDDSARELTVHSETSGESVTSSPAGPSSSGISGSVQCPQCGFRCLGKHCLDGHVKRSHGHMGRNGRLKCEWCQYSTDRPDRMKNHRRTHTGERPYGCSICKARFSRRSGLTDHMRTHTGERPYGCSICTARYTKPSALTIHMRTHTGERPYGCSICTARFSVRASLNNHMRIHTRERPYGCSICKERFTERSNLTRHMRTHTGERPHGCSHCQARFARRGDLSKHLRTHTGERPYGCSVCTARFAQQPTLTTHMRTHTGERPFGCSICKARFTRRSHLDTHIRTHTGERPYGCSHCQARFNERGRLSKHMRTHSHTKERP
ncbi:uncharacterized protein LOC122369042 isoform X3 [Amphibalanus amphitrite]|uniref:uncharacterized protein LOC122369042 isoform X3 n=1 Tax=Amphibalanus amphitrite TaxID=1232801 RepID=UPI001C9213F9|nr:uncharacterized protein LOC122369042 isoform X3 [Amphibalanus amphitrite]